MSTESTSRSRFRRAPGIFLRVCAALIFAVPFFGTSQAQELSHPRLMTDAAGIDSARLWMKTYPWYRNVVELHKQDIDRFIAHGPVYVSPLKQSYVFQMYTCPKHGVDLLYEEFKPFAHRCPSDSSEIYSGGKYDMAWAGWYHRLLATELVWMGILYNVYGDEKYASAGREILVKFADLYLSYTTDNTILGPAHVFFGTLSESFWGVDMAYGYDLLYDYKGFTGADRKALREKLFYPLATITQQFPETASNRQLWYNNVSAAVGFLYGDKTLIDFAINGKYGFRWQLGSGLPESGLWGEWSGYHFVTLRGMIHLAEMARHNGYDLYHMEIAGRTMKKMFDAPFLLIEPNFEFPRSKDSGGGSLLEYAPFYEVGYAVYRDRKYLGLLSASHLERGTQVVGESSALGRAPEPVSMFDIDPDLPRDTASVYPQESVNLAGNGFAVLRDSTFRTYLYLDYGIMGGEHGHPDRLQMGYYAGGRNWIVDPLNELYTNPNLQLWYHRSIAHNTLVVDQTDQAWTNGFGNFFGALPSFQVASGGSTTEYHGVKLTRTLIQVGDYFLDLFDAESPDVHTYDLPLHGFGELALDGLNLERQPVDLFGNKPGIPGYDQLSDIYKCDTDSSFSGEFTDRGGRLLFRVIGEPGTQVFKAKTPPIGGFYKQMTSDRTPFPLLMTRRAGTQTRFASLIQAQGGKSRVASFTKGIEPGSYVIDRGNEKDVIQADIGGSGYSIVREKDGVPVYAAGFHTWGHWREKGKFLVYSTSDVDAYECAWIGRRVNVTLHHVDDGAATDPAPKLLVYAPDADSVSVNGAFYGFEREKEFVDIGKMFRSMSSSNSRDLWHVGGVLRRDSVLFIGRKNHIGVALPGLSHTSMFKAGISLGADWQERVKGQVSWWGGIVNLAATNKGPVERRTFPSVDRSDASWIQGIASDSGQDYPAGPPNEVYMFSIDVPNDVTPAMYPAVVSHVRDTVRTKFIVSPPATASMLLRNGKKETFTIELTNQTPHPLAVSANLTPDNAWRAPGNRAPGRAHHPLGGPSEIPGLEVTLKPHETRQFDFPLRLAGYTKENQLYPIRLGLASEGFKTEITHDFYAAIAHFAKTPPSLDGSWNGWDRSGPMTIDRPSQIGRLLFGNRPWHGEKDLSAEIYAMYDRTYLYIGAAVKDDSIVTHWDFPRMGYPWDTDCMEVVIDARDNALQGHDPPTPGTYRHLCLPEYRVTDFSSLAWQGSGAPCLVKPNLVPGGETYFHRTKEGYAIIARFPLSGISGIVAKPGYKVGFDVAFNDNDGTSFRKNQHIWAGYDQNQSWWDLGTIGSLVFGPDN